MDPRGGRRRRRRPRRRRLRRRQGPEPDPRHHREGREIRPGLDRQLQRPGPGEDEGRDLLPGHGPDRQPRRRGGGRREEGGLPPPDRQGPVRRLHEGAAGEPRGPLRPARVRPGHGGAGPARLRPRAEELRGEDHLRAGDAEGQAPARRGRPPRSTRPSGGSSRPAPSSSAARTPSARRPSSPR